MARLLAVTALICAAMLLAGCAATPTAQPAEPDNRVRIFILSGQSNMTGRGSLVYERGGQPVPLEDQKPTLYGFVNRPENLEKYAFLRDGPNKTESGWTIRDDVFITMGDWPHLKPGEEGYNAYRRHGGLGPYYGGRGNRGFGPELGIGHMLGNHYDAPVLLVKVSYGGNSLARNFRPPSAGGTLGDKYPKIAEAYETAVEHIDQIIPGYTDEQGYELVGFFWNQGLSDANPPHDTEYETNLTHLINDLRKDLNAPQMKVAIGVTGNWGWGIDQYQASLEGHAKKHNDPTFMEKRGWPMIRGLQEVQRAQLAVPNRPAFKGNVITAETRDFWRPRGEFGGHGTEQHWMANGESYWLIGEAMGNAMVDLLKTAE